jgi:hypothetical protein
LLRPWPGNPEYEFRDLSYSDRGLAVYHSWLPLYSIAAAFRLAGVSPEAARRGTPPRDASQAEIDHWTVVPRLPALAFSAIFVFTAWGLGRAVHSEQAAWALGIAAATADFFVSTGRQARYYSATNAGNAVCGLAIWNAWRRGRLFDHALAGLAVGVLFHIHSLSAVAMTALYVAAFPLGRHQPRLWLRFLTAGTLVGLLVLPWAIWSGLLSQTDRIPAARHYLSLSMLLASLPSPAVLAVVGVGLAWFAASLLSVSDRWGRPFVDKTAGFYFAVVWLALSYMTFIGLMPAASYFLLRLKLMVAVPGILLTTLVITTMSRAVRPASGFLPVAGMIALLVLSGQVPPTIPVGSDRAFSDMVGLLRSWTLGPGGRIFATPNDHHVLTYYSGRSVQSIAPVRKEWLDRFAGDLVIIEGSAFGIPPVSEVQEAAQRLGYRLTAAEAKSRAFEARQLAAAHGLDVSGASVVPPLRTPDGLDLTLLGPVRETTRRDITSLIRGTPLQRVATPSNWFEWRSAFFYWFTNPGWRGGPGLNYGACRARARVSFHASGFAILDCRGTREPPLVPSTDHAEMP